MRKTKWRCCYNYQLAGYLVYQGQYRLRDIYPNKKAAEVAVHHLNSGGSTDTIPDPEYLPINVEGKRGN